MFVFPLFFFLIIKKYLFIHFKFFFLIDFLSYFKLNLCPYQPALGSAIVLIDALIVELPSHILTCNALDCCGLFCQHHLSIYNSLFHISSWRERTVLSCHISHYKNRSLSDILF